MARRLFFDKQFFAAFRAEFGPSAKPSLRACSGELEQTPLALVLGEGFTKCFRASTAVFHDVLVDQWIVFDRIVPVVACHAEEAFVMPSGLDHSLLREVAERVGTQISANLVNRM